MVGAPIRVGEKATIQRIGRSVLAVNLLAVKEGQGRKDDGSVHFSFQFRAGSNGNCVLELRVVITTKLVLEQPEC
jgi:hypothetical protein